MHIQVVDHKKTIMLQALCNGADGIIMFATCSEITKTGKEVKSVIKIIDPERQSHIVLKKMEIFIFIFFCFFNRSRRKIYPGNIKTHIGKRLTMPPFSAGYIHHGTA